MKYLVVGLGNIGAKYEGTRHNIGFDVLDHLAQFKNAKWKVESLGSTCVLRHKGRAFHLLKPSTYVNLSGKAVRYWLGKLKLDQSRLIVVVDDLNLPFGSIRIRSKGSHGGHNGLKDIQEKLNNNTYCRVRLGIGQSFHSGQQVNYVLGRWSVDEEKQLSEIIKSASEAILSIGSIGIDRAMSQYNK